MKTAPVCYTCRNGYLQSMKTFRMSAPVVVIGFLLLIPSLFGVLLGFGGLFATGAASAEAGKERIEAFRAERQAFRDLGVSESMIDLAVSGDQLPGNWLDSVPKENRLKAIELASASLASDAAAEVGSGVATVFAGGFFLFILIASFIGGLLGWLLVMRKRILKCGSCGAVVAAS